MLKLVTSTNLLALAMSEELKLVISGFIQDSLSRAEHHIWFERSEAGDRRKVVQRCFSDDVPPRSRKIFLEFSTSAV